MIMKNFTNSIERSTLLSDAEGSGLFLIHENGNGVVGYFEFTSTRPEQTEEEIREKYSTQLKALVSSYTQTEINTWHIQQTEAEAYTKDTTSPTPMITALASARGVTVDMQVAKITEKVNYFRTEAGRILGEQQKELDALGP